MSIFRSTSFRLKKRDKLNRPPPLEEMAEHKESEESSPGTSLDGHSSSHLAVPDSARSNFFTLPSGVSSRSSLFGRTSTDEKQRSFFKLPNLSRGSFILRRDREERRGNPFSADDPDASFTLMARDLENCGYVAQSKRRESASASMSNLLAGPDVIDISATSKNSGIRQRSRTMSTRSVPGAADDPLRALAALPPLTIPPRAARASVDVLSTIKSSSTPPKLSLDTPGSRISPIQLPSFMQSLSDPWSPDGSLSPTGEEPLSPDEPTIVARMVMHSPVPTIVSATSASTIQDSLLSSYEVSSSESDHDQSFSLGEADCAPPCPDESPARDDDVVDYFEQALESPTKHIPPRLTLTPSAQTSKSPRSGPIFFAFPGPPPLPDLAQTPFEDPLESYFSPETDKPTATADQPCSEPSTSRSSTLEVPHTPIRGVTVNALNAGNTPPARRIRGRKPENLQLVSPTVSSFLRSDDSSFLGVPQDEPPTTPSFLVGLAWPRPPLRQIYIDTQNPEASWHSVSRTTDERLIDGTGMVNTDPCHVIMGPGLKESGLAEAGRGTRRRSGLAMRHQQRLRPSTISSLAAFAKRTSAQASA